jgi:protein tyrosine phosphatase (PTP) superfamily phosphohydrolase (DUF442 family)
LVRNELIRNELVHDKLDRHSLIRNYWVRWGMGCALALFMTVVTYVYFRISYTYQKRFRVVAHGKMYRSGCMTANGLAAAIKAHKIRTVINLMEEAPDPLLHPHFFAPASVKESEVVEKAGARYVTMVVKYLPPNQARLERPETIERYLEVLDNPDSYPVLVHCKAGLHRTGVLIAVYRMEYEGWTWQEALAEVKANGFGERASTSANEYIQQYVISYRPKLRPGRVVERLPAVTGDLVSRPRTAPPDTFAPLPKD